MAFPALGDSKRDKLLTELSIAFRNADYIAEKVLPVVKVKERTGFYATYGTQMQRFADRGAFREPGTRAMTIDYTTAQTQYVCRARALEKRVPDELKNNSDKPYDPMRDATEFVTDQLLNTKERALATTMADATILTQNTTLAGAAQWNNYETSNPLQDILTGRTTIHNQIGQDPNVVVFGRGVWVQFIQHPDVTDRIKYVGTTSPEAVRKAVADLLEVDEVLVGRGVVITSAEGQATDTRAAIWGQHCWLLHRPARPSLMQPSFGYHFQDLLRSVEVYREDTHKADVVRVEESYDQEVISALAAYAIFSVAA